MIRNYFKGASILAVTEGLLQLKGLIVLPFLTRQFGPVNYGVWSQISVLISTLAPLIVLGTNFAILRYLPGIEPQKQKRYFSAWAFFLLALSGIYALPLLLLPNALSILIFGRSEAYISLIPLAAFWLIISQLSNAVLNWFRVKNDAKLYSLVKVTQAVLNIFAVAAVLVLKQGVFELVLYSLLGDTLLLIFSAILINRKSGWARPDFSILVPLLRFGLPLVPVGFAIWGLNYVDRLFIVQLTSLQEVGIYAVAYRIAYQIIPVLSRPWRTMFANSAAEMFNKDKTQDLQRLFDRSAGISLVLSTPAAVGLFLLGDRILPFLAPGEYIQGIPVLLFISLGYIFFVDSSYYFDSLGLIHKQRLTTLGHILAFILNLLMNYLLVPRFSILGAAIATFSSFLFLFLFAAYMGDKEQTLKTNWNFIIKIIIAVIGMAVGIRFFETWWTPSPANPLLEILVLSIAGVAVYSFFLWLFGILNKNELKLALSVLK